MGKKAKEHRKKVEKRNRIIAQERQRFEKMTKEMISKMYEQQQSGIDINTSLNVQSLDGPLSIPPTEPFNSTILYGPKI